MKQFRIRSYKWNSGVRWKAYRQDWDNIRDNLGSANEWGLYAEGFESLTHLMDWLFAGAPGRSSDYHTLQRTKPEFR